MQIKYFNMLRMKSHKYDLRRIAQSAILQLA